MIRFASTLVLSVVLVGPALAAAPAAAPVGGTALSVKAVPDAEKPVRTVEHLTRMRRLVDQVQRRVDDARNERDVVKLNCVNEKLTQMKALLKVAERAEAAMTEAVSRRDPTSDAEFARISIARSKVEGLRGETDKCIGQLAYVVDEQTKVEVQGPKEPADDVTDRTPPPTAAAAPPIVRPPAASAYY